MSGKKQKALAGWFNCPKCDKRFSRQLVTKHAGDTENICRSVYPFVKNNELFCLLNNVTTATRKIGDLPFIKNKRIASSTLFLSEELIKECGFTTFTWVSVSPLTARWERNTYDEKDDLQAVTTTVHDCPNSRYAFRVWPIPESIGSNQCNLQAILSADGFTINTLVPANSKLDNGDDAPSGLIGVQVLCSNLIDTAVISTANEVTLVVTNFHEIDEISFDIKRFIQSFNKLFSGRPIALFNRFKMRFYAQFVHFYISKVYSHDQCDEDTLGMEKLSIQEENRGFYQISSVTAVRVITKDNINLSNDNKNFNLRITFSDIGGLSSVINEVSSTVKFILNTKLDVPKGLLLYGHTGVGKTLLVHAISNEFNLFQIQYEEFSRSPLGNNRDENSSTSIEKVFKDAVQRSPSVIIVEALDVIYPRKKSDSRTAPLTQFVSQFLSLASSDQVKQGKVLILCTATDLDRVDPNIRSLKLFAKEIEIPIPSAPDREQILQKMLSRMDHELSEEEIRYISGNTHGFVAADLLSLCNQATLDVITKNQNSPAACERTTKVTVRNFEECLKSVKPSAVKSILIDVPNVKWSDIGGQDDLKFKLKQAIEWPLKHPESFKRLGITPPKGILMYGPPGCSKTMIAKAIATESGLNFISVKGSELFSKWVGESEKAVQAIFRKARQVAPCVIFFDEIDSLGGERGTSSGSSNVHERVLAQILVEMDGIEALKDVTIVAATNRPDRIDQALLRPGRLDRIVYVPLPDENTRREILKITCKKMPVDSDIDTEYLVNKTAGYSGAELSAVCREAALKALEEDINCELIKQHHFNAVLSSMTPRITKEQIDFYENYANSRKQI